MEIFSHRGLGMGLEENSLKSFEETLRQGFSLELDVQKTKDDYIIVLHDSNLKRLKGIDRQVTDLEYAEARNLGIASLEEVLIIFSRYQARLAIHVKDEAQGNILELIAELIEKYNIFDKCFVFDLTIEGMKKLKKINRRIKTAFSVAEKRFSKTIYLWEDIKDEDFDAVWWDEWNSSLYTKENLDRIRQAGKKIYAIAPDMHHIHNHPLSKYRKEEGWRNLINLGVDGICTDYPVQLKSMIKY